MNNNHGGKRPNAGRKSSDGATDLKLLQVYVTQDDVNTAVEVGEGNKSLGVRKALKGASMLGVGKGTGIPKGKRVNTFIECGCCGHYHRTDFNGDCREDSERFTFDTIPEQSQVYTPVK